jgi:salicylate hydroxylase
MLKPTITIIGAGISGLTLAAALHHRKIPIHLYESAPSFTEIGLGVSLGPAAYRILPLLNPNLNHLNTLITTHADTAPSHQQTWFEIVWATGPHEDEILMTLQAPPSGQTALRRADFLNALAGLVPAECVHFGKRLEKLESGGVLRFEDGEVVFADVVVGCDGIRSRVREAIVPSIKPVYSGMYGYRGVIGMEDMIEAVGERRACVSTIYVSEGAYAISYPIMKGRFVNVGIYVFSSVWEYEGWIRPGRREDLVRDTRGMGRFVRAFVEVCFLDMDLGLWCVRFCYLRL